MQRILGLALLVIGASVSCLAAPPAAPEIDPASGVAAITLLTGAFLVIGYRRKK
jgi:hypothetical protein